MSTTEHEKRCPFRRFEHPLACTCPGTQTRRWLDQGRPGDYDPSRGKEAELMVKEWLESQGLRVARTDELYADFPNPGLANSGNGDELAIDPRTGSTSSDEVKEITRVGRMTGNVIIGRWSLENTRAERIICADPEERIITVTMIKDVRDVIDRLEEWQDGKLKLPHTLFAVRKLRMP